MKAGAPSPRYLHRERQGKGRADDEVTAPEVAALHKIEQEVKNKVVYVERAFLTLSSKKS